MKAHWFWWTLLLAVLIWYSTVTVYVAVRGTLDIRNMLRRLAERPRDEQKNDQSGPGGPRSKS